MRILRAAPLLVLLLLGNGCAYVHFGRLPDTAPPPPGDATLATAYTDLSTQHKILQQELALARKEGDAMRFALEQHGDAGSAQLATRLTETARELSALRASYAELQSQSATGRANATLRGQLASTEEKLAATLHDYTKLQEENTRLRTDLDRAHEENAGLATQLRVVVAKNDNALAAISELNVELLAQKAARNAAEQRASAARSQLATVLAAGPAGLAAARESSATSAGAFAARPDPATQASPAGAGTEAAKSGLSLPDASAASAPPTAELHTSSSRLAATSQLTVRDGQRIYVVRAGDTLESIAQKFYGVSARWSKIFASNLTQLSDDRPIKPGMELIIPNE
jgi:LysM repeat protein